mmetsp:Transcript_5395/g.11884  ORF Transcript_5395/g.11884 Transcript_5395/m.11884 type:complete len:815 (-) Transcript_5395:535-2979(-)|eukprot:CAMPEP_0202895226 /NCGR_PEP_ID=MMETSP1392-20130828/4471_1 /ASSEMBLY_ACC=CAM_ASM_000868 /TAXON_ID=225041 /ORGANISM="Chlamydomonas chlamydogama, Strain SAG 11-48b" /LENGTH=814 /DNA_ID=CAMNT_0049580163 /DNA_START=44 /DNA_END=2488 /DNA_ORIENTATION=-
MEERRESRIPRPTIPRGTLSDRGNVPIDRKRKASPALEAVPESKRANNDRPSKSVFSAPAAAGQPTVSTAAAPSFRSEGNPKPVGPAPGEESFEDIAERTGVTVVDVLSKKMAFKKGTKPDKKVEEMVPMIKELRAVGWHLLSAKERLELDGQQWKAHSEELEQTYATEKQQWNAKQDAIEQQMKEIQALLDAQEKNNTKLSEDLNAAEAMINEKTTKLQAMQLQLESVTSDLDKAQKTVNEKDGKIREMEDVVRHSQSYSSTLQSYNTSLQNDIKEEKNKREELSKQRDGLQAQAAELSGKVKSYEQLLQFEREQVEKLRTEREAAARDIAVLRADLDSTRQERDRLLAENTKAKEEVDRIRSAGGKSLETLEALNNDKATLEVQLTTQQKLIAGMREDLGMAKEQRAIAEGLSESRGAQIAEYKVQVQQLQESLADAEKRVYEAEIIRRKLHNIIQELKGNIRVFCRVRPLSGAEESSEQDSAMAVEFPPSAGDLLGAGVALQVPQRGESHAAAGPVKHNFTFDRVFNPTATQEQVFEEISELVQSALDGHKVCIFAYGQTGSGKTFTMLGNAENPGMIPRAIQQVFETSNKLKAQGWSFTMQASMLEIYNEEYKDLLGRKGKQADAKKHQVLHNADGSTTVTDITTVDVTQPARVEALLSEAMEKRSVGCTAMNEQSSRSHMVFTLKIDGHNSITDVRVAGVLNLIDLAGSERVKESGATGIRLKEAQSINTSLSALGDVIMALANKQQHVPFRNSKLTYLLQPCLGGDAKTLMFVNLAPSKEYAQESLCSLRFAAKVNACEINPKKNVRV